MKKLKLIIALLALTPAAASAQALWLDAGASASITKHLGASVEGEWRSADGIDATSRWSIDAGLDYKICPWLKGAVSYTYIDQRNPSTVTRKGNIVDSFWQSRHRLNVSLTGKLKVDRFTFSLRERYQLTHREGVTVAKRDTDGTPKTPEYEGGDNKSVLRSRLQVEYDIRKCPVTPYVSFEIYNSLNDGFATDKTRYTVGADYKINKHNTVGVYYRYIHENGGWDDGDARNVIGASYTYKFSL